MVEIFSEQVRQREDVDYSKAGANGVLTAACGVPGKSDTGNDISQRGFLYIGLPE